MDRDQESNLERMGSVARKAAIGGSSDSMHCMDRVPDMVLAAMWEASLACLPQEMVLAVGRHVLVGDTREDPAPHEARTSILEADGREGRGPHHTRTPGFRYTQTAAVAETSDAPCAHAADVPRGEYDHLYQMADAC